MSSEPLKLEKDLCRCCHAEGSFKNLDETCYTLGQSEVYSSMLRIYLDIELNPVVGLLCSVTYTICEACILRLRDAINFKRQVLLCEERFQDLYSRNLIESLSPGVEVKQELEVDDEKFSDGFKNSKARLPSLDVICGSSKADFTLSGLKEESPLDDDDGGFDARFDDEDDNKQLIVIKIEDAKKNKGKSKAKPKAAKKSPTKKAKARKMKACPKEEETAAGAEEKPKKGGKRYGPKFILKESDYRREENDYICTHCEKRYDKIFSLRFHIKTKHYKIPRYICPYCKKDFMTPAPLTTHKLEEHNIDERFKCKACNSVFNTKVQLRKHINNFHMLGEKYKCEFCDYESFSFEGMYKHKFKHKTVKDYHCRFCRKSFLRKATLDLHERIHTGDRRKICKVCGQAFVQKASLNYHMTKYHPEVNF